MTFIPVHVTNQVTTNELTFPPVEIDHHRDLLPLLICLYNQITQTKGNDEEGF